MKSSMATTSNSCYVDTSAFIALLDRGDEHHLLFRRLFAQPPALIASALVVAEGHSWFLRKYGATHAWRFLVFVRELSQLRLAAFDEDSLNEAIRIAEKFSDQLLTLADAHGLAIMKQLRLSSCWSTDRHFELTGVQLVIRN